MDKTGEHKRTTVLYFAVHRKGFLVSNPYTGLAGLFGKIPANIS